MFSSYRGDALRGGVLGASGRVAPGWGHSDNSSTEHRVMFSASRSALALARVKAILRRAELNKEAGQTSKEIITCGQIVLDPDKRKVLRGGAKVELTPKEFDLLFLFMANPGKSYSREELLNVVWGYEFKGYEHTVNSHINRLRTKIEPDLSKPEYILTTWGVGYRFTDEK